jgi:hypothetical protein
VAQLKSVLVAHVQELKDTCWERRPYARTQVNANATFTVDSNGTPLAVTVVADEPTLAACLEDSIRRWRFPAMGCSQPVALPFHFLRQ